RPRRRRPRRQRRADRRPRPPARALHAPDRLPPRRRRGGDRRRDGALPARAQRARPARRRLAPRGAAPHARDGARAAVAPEAAAKQRRRRSGPRLGATREIWRARDGDVSFGLRGGPARAASLAALVEYMAESDMAPEWLRKMDWRAYNHNELDAASVARLEAA